ncbi:PQQ-dependent sugar dehydrogenase [Williamsia sp.]|uniref:PQQ-dependent sugar dehydrogenase n=1 Tax=Williamsia sp. TaxID=1872085 RepID=UPI002F920FFC
MRIRVRIILSIVGATLIAACSGGPASTAPTNPIPWPPSSSGFGSSEAPGAPEDVVTGLDAPWSVVFTQGAALISERDTGNILEIVGDGTRVVGAVRDVAPAGEGGLLGLAAGEGELYVYFTGTAGDNRVVKYPLTGSAGTLGLGEPEDILTGIPGGRTHNGGRIAFGPDGMLYVTTGDAQDRPSAQDPASLAGKILRVTADGGVPADNPTSGSPVWSLGHRNVQGLAWSADGTMFSVEYGQDAWDELNIIRPGGNYGWPEVEGIGQDPAYINPVQQWRPDVASPSGMTIAGQTIYVANLRGERLRAIPVNNPSTAEELYVRQFGRLRDVAVAPDGSLWFLTNNTDGRGIPRPDDDRIKRVVVG